MIVHVQANQVDPLADQNALIVSPHVNMAFVESRATQVLYIYLIIYSAHFHILIIHPDSGEAACHHQLSKNPL